jgi:hypothetical protein
MPREQTPVRDRADELGIKYHHNASDETIEKLIDSHQETEDPVEGLLPLNECQPLDEKQYKRKYPKQAADRKKAGRLIRCRIQCMNPAKKDWPGEIFSVGSAKLGTFKKFVPFNSPEPYHIPKIIYDMLVEKKCTVFYTETDQRGNKTRKGRLVNEFAIEVLEPLTKQELDELARRQALAGGNQ